MSHLHWHRGGLAILLFSCFITVNFTFLIIAWRATQSAKEAAAESLKSMEKAEEHKKDCKNLYTEHDFEYRILLKYIEDSFFQIETFVITVTKNISSRSKTGIPELYVILKRVKMAKLAIQELRYSYALRFGTADDVFSSMSFLHSQGMKEYAGIMKERARDENLPQYLKNLLKKSATELEDM